MLFLGAKIWRYVRGGKAETAAKVKSRHFTRRPRPHLGGPIIRVQTSIPTFETDRGI